MSTTLSLAECHKMMKTMNTTLRSVPNVFSFSTKLDFSQLSLDSYKGKFFGLVNKDSVKYKKKITEYLQLYDDIINMKSLVCDKNAESGLNDVLTELSNIDFKVKLYKSILDNIDARTNNPYAYGGQQEFHELDTVEDVYSSSKHEYKTIVEAAQFSGKMEKRPIFFSLFKEDDIQMEYDIVLRRKTSLEKKRDLINQETSIELDLSNYTKKLCGI